MEASRGVAAGARIGVFLCMIARICIEIEVLPRDIRNTIARICMSRGLTAVATPFLCMIGRICMKIGVSPRDIRNTNRRICILLGLATVVTPMGRTTINLDDDVHAEAQAKVDNLSEFVSRFLRDALVLEGVGRDDALDRARIRALRQERYLLDQQRERITTEIERLERRLATDDPATPAEAE